MYTLGIWFSNFSSILLFLVNFVTFAIIHHIIIGIEENLIDLFILRIGFWVQ